MKNRERVIELIESKRETEFCDFKRDFYKRLPISDLPRDISAFANLASGEDCYIIFGVEDKTRRIYGIEPATFASTDDIDNYIHKTVEPFLTIESDTFEYGGKTVGYIKVSKTNDNPPYIIKRNCGIRGTIRKGDIYIRRGTCNQKAERSDLDRMYSKNGSCEIRLFDGNVHVSESAFEPTGYLVTFRLEIENSKQRPVLIKSGNAKIYSGKNILKRGIRSIAESPLELDETSRSAYTVSFPIRYTDMTNSLNFSGNKNLGVRIRIELTDTDNCKYTSEIMAATLIKE